jgi:hypothetical protein
MRDPKDRDRKLHRVYSADTRAADTRGWGAEKDLENLKKGLAEREARDRKVLDEEFEKLLKTELSAYSDEDLGCAEEERCIMETPADGVLFADLADAEAEGKKSFGEDFRRVICRDERFVIIISRSCFEQLTGKAQGDAPQAP